MKLPDGAEDYYEWLSKRMGDREPLLSWAKREKENNPTSESENGPSGGKLPCKKRFRDDIRQGRG
jgi:hypothetical protein